ncbi:NAD(P)/FAD-dependent oxidoreductase [Burkholderia multivorans]|uniref:NAD(P)/FAD-dependent oxidoreductase n=1 Tax=Burkholderia multivorans TaxID=87883 RepID=UPI0007568470|nr:FAD-dependent oxidoreductase [Burkholderia multivorans]KVS10439.1 FAD-dependent oxidoreductase [Burkholderia multivorans]MDN8104213.1 FAD-dependent oxidoreductase [Burkholderia multivorans]
MSTQQSAHTRFAVIGGGLVGSAIAYGLAKQDEEVAVFDEGDLAFRASRANFGLVWVQSKGLGMPAYAAWTLRSASLWAQLAAELIDATGVDPQLAQPGGLHILLSDEEWARRKAFLEKLHAQPGFPRYPWRLIERAELKSMYPGIGPQVVGASYTQYDGHANPLRLLHALHTAFAQRRVVYRPHHAVHRIEPLASGFAIHAAGTRYTCDRVVIAAGLANARLAPMVGLHVPVRPQRGEIIVLERMKPFLRHPVLTLRQTGEGTVMIAEAKVEAGFDKSTDMGVLGALARRAVKTFPALGDARAVRMWGALRILSPDGFPIYAQSAQYPGAFAATCHSGVTLAGAHALDLARQLASGELDARMEPFSPGRFAQGVSHVSH